jgi:Ca2+-binding EF-hand superfamily protein
MKTIKSVWNNKSRTARMTALAGAATVILGGTLAAGVAVAADDAPHMMDRHGHGPMGSWHGGPGGMSERAENRLFERLDTDKNGEISRDEVAAARQKREQRLAEMDTDKNGDVSREERRAYFAKAIEARRTEAFAKADTDGDGGLALDEYKAQATEHAIARASERFTRLDKNGDGKLSVEELTSQRPMRGQPPR